MALSRTVSQPGAADQRVNPVQHFEDNARRLCFYRRKRIEGAEEKQGQAIQVLDMPKYLKEIAERMRVSSKD